LHKREYILVKIGKDAGMMLLRDIALAEKATC
jgi:hypothetical protein